MTYPPSEKQIDVALESLRSDAGAWAHGADTASHAKSMIRGLNLGAFDFSNAADLAGVTDAYRKVQEKIAGLLSQASDGFESVSKALNQCADTYEREDEAGAHELGKLMRDD